MEKRMDVRGMMEMNTGNEQRHLYEHLSSIFDSIENVSLSMKKTFSLFERVFAIKKREKIKNETVQRESPFIRSLFLSHV